MYKIHSYLDGRGPMIRRIPHLPRVGDTVRLSSETYAEITEVVWCFDEAEHEGQRVNLRLETLKEEI